MLNIGWRNYLPISEARGALCTVSIGLCATLCLICQISVWSSRVLIVISVYLPPYFPILLSLYLSLWFPHICPPPPTSTATLPALITRIPRAGCYHHCLDSRSPGFFSSTRHKYMIGRVSTYRATLFWRQAIYIPISSIPTVTSSAPMGGYITRSYY